MRKTILFFICISVWVMGYSQQIHSPMEIIKMMSDSKLSYEIKTFDKTIECKDYSDNLNYHDVYRVATDSGLFTYSYLIKEKAKPLLEVAEFYFKANITDSALIYYKLTLAQDSSLYNVMTYIGQIYGNKGDYANANIWYKKAIAKNYIDYMAHWFLADSYLEINEIDKAIDEIVVAQILNRNNIRIKKSLMNILNKAKRNTTDWCFNPQIEITKVSDVKISIALTDKWTGYAMAKALWLYEPGYKESMGVSKGQYSTIEDKECLISLLIGLENAKIKIKKDPQLMVLKEAAENKNIEEYIFYEIVLPQNPFVAFQLQEKTINDIKNYILNFRYKK